jgi:hypothetical protein
MNNDTQNCPFCHPDSVLFGNDLAYAKPDKFPVNPGHLLIIPRRHVADFFLTTEEERAALFTMLDKAKNISTENMPLPVITLASTWAKWRARLSCMSTCTSYPAIRVIWTTRAAVCAA